ncbi:MAG: sulfurtransferase [Terrimicrobiaceae bacterium]
MFTNIAAYKFARLRDLKPLRERLVTRCKSWGLKGTILLSEEGINLFVAGLREEVDHLVAELRAIPGLEELAPKFSESTEQPFTRMLVRIKKEIIAFGVDGIDPATRPAPKLSARTLKQWLDEGRPLTLLDTRNDYEVKLGTFRGAKTLNIDHFREFPEAVRRLPGEMKEQAVVMFCTGGIRCEKAGPFMQREGFQNVLQLDGGILKYFEECGGDHYDGECFVFDQRVGVDPALRETESTQCYVCQTPLDAEEQRDARFVAGKSCPYCFKSSAEVMAQSIVLRHEIIRQAATPLPGSIPCDNRRPLNVPEKYDGQCLLDALCGIFGHIPRENWLQLCAEGAFVSADDAPVSADHIVRAGERYFRLSRGEVEPAVSADIRILHEDEALVVVNKPAPLPMHAGGRFNRNTLQFFLQAAYAPQRPRGVHRLDASTTGVVVCARTRHFAKLLQPQFENGEVKKVYLARVQGWPADDDFSCDAPISAGPVGLGARAIDEVNGLSARTEFRLIERRDDGTALLEARPLTGRTNQIRVHLWHLGHPICGDPAYLRGHQTGDSLTPGWGEPPLCLHAWRLEFTHPLTNERVEFTAEPPAYL